MLYILLAPVGVLIILHVFLLYTRSGRLHNKIPGPKPKLFVGNGYEIWGSAIPLFYKGRLLANKFGNINRMWAAYVRVLNLYDPDDIEVVLSSPKYIEKGDMYKFLHPWLNGGLVVAKGHKWQSRRKILTPTFHFNILRQFCTVFTEQSNKLVEKLQSEVGKDETAILSFMGDFTLNIICETAMGISLDSSGSFKAEDYKQAVLELGGLMVHRFTTMFYHLDFKFTQDVIDERRKSKRFIAEDYNNQDNIIGTKKRLAMLDLLLLDEDKGLIDNAGIREEVDTFMFAAHDTTTMSLTFTLMMLANHPEVQDKIVAEVDEIVWDPNSITFEELNKMQYLERCLKEALRLYPSVPFMSRQITEDMQLKNYLIPAGTLCNIHSYDVHRNANLYPNPDKFDPDRFLPENCLKRHPFAYIPFSAGPRNCIGQKFGMLEQKAVVAAILKRFKLEAVTRPDDIIFSADLVLKSYTPIKIKVTARSQ